LKAPGPGERDVMGRARDAPGLLLMPLGERGKGRPTQGRVPQALDPARPAPVDEPYPFKPFFLRAAIIPKVRVVLPQPL